MQQGQGPRTAAGAGLSQCSRAGPSHCSRGGTLTLQQRQGSRSAAGQGPRTAAGAGLSHFSRGRALAVQQGRALTLEKKTESSSWAWGVIARALGESTPTTLIKDSYVRPCGFQLSLASKLLHVCSLCMLGKCPSLKHGAFPQTFSCQRNTKALTLHQLLSLPELVGHPHACTT